MHGKNPREIEAEAVRAGEITLISIAQPLNGMKMALPIQRTIGEIYGKGRC